MGFYEKPIVKRRFATAPDRRGPEKCWTQNGSVRKCYSRIEGGSHAKTVASKTRVPYKFAMGDFVFYRRLKFKKNF